MTHTDDFPVVDKRRPLTIGRFQEVQSHWPPSGNESWKATVTSVPIRDGRGFLGYARYAEVADTDDDFGIRFLGPLPSHFSRLHLIPHY
jgi:hypothetical protein